MATVSVTRTLGPFMFWDDDNKPITWAEALRLMVDKEEKGVHFRRRLVGAINHAKTEFVFWECEPATAATAPVQPFRFVVLETDYQRPFPDKNTFRGKLDGWSPSSFPSEEGDAILVAPSTDMPWLCGGIKSFCTAGDYTFPLLALLGKTIREALDAAPLAPIFVSTHGLGVPWLHVRVERRPKYYTYKPFCVMSATPCVIGPMDMIRTALRIIPPDELGRPDEDIVEFCLSGKARDLLGSYDGERLKQFLLFEYTRLLCDDEDEKTQVAQRSAEIAEVKRSLAARCKPDDMEYEFVDTRVSADGVSFDFVARPFNRDKPASVLNATLVPTYSRPAYTLTVSVDD